MRDAPRPTDILDFLDPGWRNDTPGFAFARAIFFSGWLVTGVGSAALAFVADHPAFLLGALWPLVVILVVGAADALHAPVRAWRNLPHRKPARLDPPPESPP